MMHKAGRLASWVCPSPEPPSACPSPCVWKNFSEKIFKPIRGKEKRFWSRDERPRRWRAATQHNGRSPQDYKRDAVAAWRRFVSCSSHCCQNKDCLSGAPHTNKALVAYVMAECEPLARQ